MKKKSALRLYLHSFSYMGPDRGKYILGVLLCSCEYALLFAVPYVNQELIDIVTGAKTGNLMGTLLMMLGLFLLFAPPVVLGTYLRTICAEKGIARQRKMLFRHIINMPYSQLVKYRTGDYLTRLSDDVGRAAGALGRFSMVQLLRFIAVFPVTLALLLINDWRIALAGLIYGGINMAFSMYLNPKSKRQEAAAKAEIAHSASFLIEALRGIPVVRVFVMHKVLAERYKVMRETIREKRMRYQDFIGVTYGTVDFFAQSAQAVGFIIGVLLSMASPDRSASLGQVVFNASLMGMMGDAVYRLSTFLLLEQPNLVAMERVEQLLSTPIEDLDTGGKHLDTSRGEVAVEFRDVCFSYDGERQVLKGLSFALHRGENLAIVGGSGGGKSTVVKLMEAFYRPDSGEIRYFGRDGSELSLSCIRGCFAYVPQECSLFDGSLGENIALSQPEASQGEIEAAARMADIHDFITALPNGYGTGTGEGGGQLSGGQRQRVAIARALLKNAPVLLLDEATAALDSSAEKEVQACLDRIAGQMTTLTVAHRLSTVENADRILVIEAGQIVEEGKFHELLDRKGRFWEIYEAQQRDEAMAKLGMNMGAGYRLF